MDERAVLIANGKDDSGHSHEMITSRGSRDLEADLANYLVESVLRVPGS